MQETIHTLVFQAQEGGGNPCPVTLDAGRLSAEEMQAMTRACGEEAVFLARSEGAECTFRARYFVPDHEMGMCVHATIGSATVLVQTGRVQTSPIWYETDCGTVQVDWERREDGTVDVGVHQFLPKFMENNPVREEVCRALNIREEDLGDGPIQSAATSRWKLMVPLRSRAVLDGLQPDFEALWALCDRYETSGFYPFVMETGPEGEPVFWARQFPQRAGYDEDPATGVAASALGAYLVEHHMVPVREGWNSCTVFQGFAMGKPSVIRADSFVENGRITDTRVCGTAVLD